MVYGGLSILQMLRSQRDRGSPAADARRPPILLPYQAASERHHRGTGSAYGASNTSTRPLPSSTVCFGSIKCTSQGHRGHRVEQSTQSNFLLPLYFNSVLSALLCGLCVLPFDRSRCDVFASHPTSERSNPECDAANALRTAPPRLTMWKPFPFAHLFYFPYFCFSKKSTDSEIQLHMHRKTICL